MALSGAVVLLAVGSVATGQLRGKGPASLRGVISRQYPDVAWISTGRLAAKLHEDSSVVLLDIREADEFRVSHLRGARRVAPGTTDFDALALSAEDVVVVYCSVGYRSAATAQALEEAGVEHVFNLTGGIFQWANEERSIYRGDERVSEVHPYDAVWGRMLDDAHRASLAR